MAGCRSSYLVPDFLSFESTCFGVFHLCLLPLQPLLDHLEAPVVLLCTSSGPDKLSHWVLARLTACLCWPHPVILSLPSLPSRLPPLVGAAVWSVLPWHRAATSRLHKQHLVFSSQRAADKIEGRWRKTGTLWQQPCELALRTLQLCLTPMRSPLPCRHSGEGQSQTWPHWIFCFLSLCSALFNLHCFYFFLTCRLIFTRNHFFGNETGVFPHIMHINGYQWLSV